MKRINRKGIVVLGFVAITLIIIWISFHNNTKKEEVEIYKSEEPDSTWIPLHESGKGEGSEEDAYLIMSKDNFGITDIFPGRAYIQTEMKSEVKKMSRYVDGDWATRYKIYFDYYYAVLYDLETNEEIQRIDLNKAVQQACSGFQPSWGYIAVLGKNGECYLSVQLENIPEKSTDEKVEKMIFIDIDTGETIVKDSVDEGREFIWAQSSEANQEYKNSILNADRKAFEEANGYNTDKTESRFNILPGITGGTGCIRVTISCEALPQKNDILYERFPGLEKWIGAKEKEAYIYIGGYPTINEIMAMFEKQELQN